MLRSTALALAAIARGHEVCYLTPGDFVLRPNDSLMAHATLVKGGKAKKADVFVAALQGDQANPLMPQSEESFTDLSMASSDEEASR